MAGHFLIVEADFYKDIAETLKSSDIFCFPSFYVEGFAKVLLEACAAGLPIVTTDHPGCREAVINERNGFLVPVKDATAVANAIEQLAKNEPLRRSMSAEARKMAEANFSVKTVVKNAA